MAAESKITKLERENYLIKLQKEFASTGAVIPEHIIADGKNIPLRSYIFNISKQKGRLSQQEQQEADSTASMLQKKRRELVKRLSLEDLTFMEADDIYRTITGIDRALDTLYQAHEPRSSMKEEYKKARLQDGRRWLDLVRKTYSRDEDNSNRRRS